MYLSPQMLRLPLLIFITLQLFTSSAIAQEEGGEELLSGMLDSATLSKQRIFRNLGDALVQPDSVFRLDLSKQKRKEVPEQIRQFKNLQVLKLSRNNLREIPEWIGDLKHLQVLDLGYNKLAALPDSIGACRELTFLGLNRNLMETLPRTIGRLRKLRVLEMWDNEVQALPEEIKFLYSLQVLELRGILFSEAEQQQIRSLLPEAEIYFDPSCNCKN